MLRNVVSALIIGLLLMTTLASCQTLGDISKLLPPVLTSQPNVLPCKVNDKPVDCVVLSKEDWEDVVRWIKHACLTSGGTDEECGTNDPLPD